MSPLGPTFRKTGLMAANSTVRPLQEDSWIYRVVPFNCMVYVGLVADAVGLKYTFSAGSDMQAGPDSPVSAGGTAGVFIDDVNRMDQYLANAGDELTFVIRETAGVATTDYNLTVRLQPI